MAQNRKTLEWQAAHTKQGVPLYVARMPQAKTVAAGVLIRAGTRDENWPQEAGLAHALEHMHLQGTKKYPSQLALGSHIENIGGYLNAWTWQEMTFHYARVPASFRGFAVENVAERLRHPLIPSQQIRSEMSNIVQEIRRNHDNPQTHARRQAAALAYGDHPLGRDTLGTEEAVSNFQPEDFRSFIRRYYHSGNYVFLAAGDITVKEAVGLFSSRFPELIERTANSRPLSHLFPAERLKPSRLADQRIERSGLKQAHLVMVARGPGVALWPEDIAALDLFADALGEGLSATLFQEVRNRLGLCYEVKANFVPWSDGSHFVIYVGTDPAKVEKAKAAIHQMIEVTSFAYQRLQVTKKMRIGRLALESEHTGHVLYQGATDTIFRTGPQGQAAKEAEIKAVTSKKIQEVVRLYLQPHSWGSVLVGPTS